MKKFLILFILSLNWVYASPEYRVIETSPYIKNLLQKELGLDSSLNNLIIKENDFEILSRIVHEKTGKCGGFFDITNEDKILVQEAFKRNQELASLNPYPYIRVRSDIISALNQIRSDYIENFVKKYSGTFKTRYAKSREGVEAPKWLAEVWRNMAIQKGRNDIKVELIDAPKSYNQYNVRVTIPGEDESLPVVILGGHLDSINQYFGVEAPGADDNASGIAAITEVYRVLLENNFKGKRTIQLMGYAAEELGLYGSYAVAEHYARDEVKVRAVMQLDMVGYPGESNSVTFITDYVSANLTNWTKELYYKYVGKDVKEDRCGYACSDHASWTRFGYESVFPFESPNSEMNHRIHTPKDTWDQYMSSVHASKFSKLAYAFLVTLSTEN
jgi:leucyl aminopeptidase